MNNLNKMLFQHVEDGVVWLESEDSKKSMDIPAFYECESETFTLTEECEMYWVEAEEPVGGFVFLARHNLKCLVVECLVTDEGFEIQDGSIYSLHELSSPSIH